MEQNHFLLVDGYNIIFSWDSLKTVAANNLEDARDMLLDMMCNYSGYTGEQVIVVFDAHKVIGGLGSKTTYKNIWIVFTQEAQTADHYIERAVSKFERGTKVRVATSDTLEQVIIMAKGAIRVTAEAFLHEYQIAGQNMEKQFKDKRSPKRDYLADRLDADTANWLEKMRRG